MKVLVLSNMYPSVEKPYAGIFVKNQIEILRERHGERVQVVCKAMPRRFTGRFGSALKYAGFALRCIPVLFRRFDVVHVHYFMPTVLLGWIYRKLHSGSRLVVTFHGGDVNDAHFTAMKGRFWRRISKSIDCAIVVGPAVEKQVSQHLDISRIVLQPAGIDSRRFYLPGREQVSKEFDFVFAGSFSHRKGLDLLLQALEDSRLIAARIVFVGTGPMREAILPLVEEGRSELLDHLTQDEMRDVFWKSRFIVLPSRSEPFGLVVSEAMFCGVPAIVSDEPGLKMQVADARNGLVFGNGDVDRLADCLAQAMEMDDARYDNLSRTAGASNREFDILNVVDSLIEIYSDLSRGVQTKGPH